MHTTLFCVHCSPEWFFGIDSLLEALFFFFLLVLAWYSYRVYRFTGLRQYRYWSVGFLLISFAYLSQALVNFIIYHNVVETVTSPLVVQAVLFARAFSIGMLLRATFFVLGYLALAFVALHLEDWRVIPFFVALALATAFATLMFPWILELVVIMTLVYLILLTARRRGHRRGVCNCLVVAGFSLVLVGQLAYLSLELGSLAYVIGHLFEFLGYCSLFTSFLIVLRTRS